MKSLFIFIITMFYCNSFTITTNSYEGYVFYAKHNVWREIINQKERYTPTENDISEAERLIKEQLIKINTSLENQFASCPIIHKNLPNYYRQYIGYINSKGEKIIWINFIWKEKADVNKLKTDIVETLDGCSYFWNIEVNISKGELSDFNINGLG